MTMFELTYFVWLEFNAPANSIYKQITLDEKNIYCNTFALENE